MRRMIGWFGRGAEGTEHAHGLMTRGAGGMFATLPAVHCYNNTLPLLSLITNSSLPYLSLSHPAKVPSPPTVLLHVQSALLSSQVIARRGRPRNSCARRNAMEEEGNSGAPARNTPFPRLRYRLRSTRLSAGNVSDDSSSSGGIAIDPVRGIPKLTFLDFPGKFFFVR